MSRKSQTYTQAQAQEVARQLIEKSQGFNAMPLPFDLWEIEVDGGCPPLPAPLAPCGSRFDDWIVEVERCIGTSEPLSKTGRGDFFISFLRGLSPAEAIQADRVEAQA